MKPATLKSIADEGVKLRVYCEDCHREKWLDPLTGAIIREQTWLVNNIGLATAGGHKRTFQRVRDITRAHRRAKLSGDDIARVIIQYCWQVKPAPADNLQIGEVGLPELIDGRGLIFKLARRLHDDKVWAGDQVKLT